MGIVQVLLPLNVGTFAKGMGTFLSTQHCVRYRYTLNLYRESTGDTQYAQKYYLREGFVDDVKHVLSVNCSTLPITSMTLEDTGDPCHIKLSFAMSECGEDITNIAHMVCSAMHWQTLKGNWPVRRSDNLLRLHRDQEWYVRVSDADGTLVVDDAYYKGNASFL